MSMCSSLADGGAAMLHRRLTVIVLVGLFVFGGTGADRCASQENKAKDAKKPTSVPLDTIYSTNAQQELKSIWEIKNELFPPLWKQLRRSTEGMNMSNVFVARADTVIEALCATRAAFVFARPVDEPVKPDTDSDPKGTWLVAYFGKNGSS